MASWHMRRGKLFWMVQWSFDGWVSLGIHIDLKRRVNSETGQRYGPYVDIHFIFFIFSIGYRPFYSNPIAGDLIGRGGIVCYGNDD